MIFSSTPETNDDPKPYEYPSGHRNDVGGAYAGEWPRILPRPEFDRAHQPNPILVQVRSDVHEDGSLWAHSPQDWLDDIATWGRLGGNPLASYRHVEHAKKVLGRLARLQEEVNA